MFPNTKVEVRIGVRRIMAQEDASDPDPEAKVRIGMGQIFVQEYTANPNAKAKVGIGVRRMRNMHPSQITYWNSGSGVRMIMAKECASNPNPNPKVRMIMA